MLEVSRDAVRNPTEGSSGPTVCTVKTLLGKLIKKAVWPIKIRGKKYIQKFGQGCIIFRSWFRILIRSGSKSALKPKFKIEPWRVVYAFNGGLEGLKTSGRRLLSL